MSIDKIYKQIFSAVCPECSLYNPHIYTDTNTHEHGTGKTHQYKNTLTTGCKYPYMEHTEHGTGQK